MKKGSITVYFALMLTIVIAVITASIESAKSAASRMMIMNGIDQSLYSIFGEYDRDLLEKYNLFFLDGSYGSDQLQPGVIYHRAEEYMKEIIDPAAYGCMGQTLHPKVESGGITGYALATDLDGNIFKAQVVSYMQDTLGISGVQLLLEKLEGQAKQVLGFEDEKEQVDTQLAQQEKKEQEEQENQTDPSVPAAPPVQDPTFINPIDVIKNLRNAGVLGLVVKDLDSLSTKSVNLDELVSNRSLQTGMGTVSLSMDVNSATANLLFIGYLQENMGCYTSVSGSGGLDYQMEYILEGKASDQENLKGVVKKLLLIREAANTVHIYSDSTKRAEVSAMATTISSAIGLPILSKAVELALVLSWAFGESIVDVRNLLSGEKIPLVKDAGSWQLSLTNLANVESDTESSKSQRGLSYDQYLLLLLYMQQKTNQTFRTMDMIEVDMRTNQNRPNFSMDSCISSLELQLQVQAGRYSHFEVIRDYSYDM